VSTNPCTSKLSTSQAPYTSTSRSSIHLSSLHRLPIPSSSPHTAQHGALDRRVRREDASSTPRQARHSRDPQALSEPQLEAAAASQQEPEADHRRSFAQRSVTIGDPEQQRDINASSSVLRRHHGQRDTCRKHGSTAEHRASSAEFEHVGLGEEWPSCGGRQRHGTCAYIHKYRVRTELPPKQPEEVLRHHRPACALHGSQDTATLSQQGAIRHYQDNAAECIRGLSRSKRRAYHLEMSAYLDLNRYLPSQDYITCTAKAGVVLLLHTTYHTSRMTTAAWLNSTGMITL
jgi:hypothetical protein